MSCLCVSSSLKFKDLPQEIALELRALVRVKGSHCISYIQDELLCISGGYCESSLIWQLINSQILGNYSVTIGPQWLLSAEVENELRTSIKILSSVPSSLEFGICITPLCLQLAALSHPVPEESLCKICYWLPIVNMLLHSSSTACSIGPGTLAFTLLHGGSQVLSWSGTFLPASHQCPSLPGLQSHVYPDIAISIRVNERIWSSAVG